MITETTLPDGPLLVVHAHPDDETLATGGLIATWAGTGRPVTLVTCTRGERGEVIGAALAHLEGDGPALAEHREGELAGALGALGVADHVFLDALPTRAGFPAAGQRLEDSGMAWVGDGAPGASGQAGAASDVPERALVRASLEECAARLATLLRDRRPAVVVTYEPGGGYGHPDHVRAHEITTRALALAAEADDDHAGHVPEHVWWNVVPPRVLSAARASLARRADGDPWFQALLQTHPSASLPQGPLPAVAAPERDVVATVDVRPVLGQVADALRAHATQVHWIESAEPAGPTGAAATDDASGHDAAQAAAAAPPESEEVLGWYALSNDVLVPWLAHEYYAAATPQVPTQQTARPAVQATVSEDR